MEIVATQGLEKDMWGATVHMKKTEDFIRKYIWRRPVLCRLDQTNTIPVSAQDALIPTFTRQRI